MRKLFLFVIATILIAPNAWAVGSVTDDTWTCPNGYTVCSAYIHCCVPPGKQCNAENCRSSGTILPTKCPDECQNIGTWTNTTDGTNRQVMCMDPYSESAYCSYRCRRNYYVAGYLPTIVGSGDGSEIFSCVACPANATCEDQTAIGPNCNSGYYRHAVLCRKPGSPSTSISTYRTYECLPCPSGASCDGGSDKPVCDENTELMPLGGTEIPLCTDYRQSTTDSDGCGVTYSCHACPTFIGMWPGETLLDTHLPGITGAPGSTLVENSDGITSCYAITGASVMDENGMFEVVYNYCKYQE